MKKRNVDEREQMEMYKIEHYMFWIVFWLLLGSIMIQAVIMGSSFKEFGFEWTIFMFMAIGSTIGYVKGGHWDYSTKPGLKSSLLYSLAGTTLFSIIFTIGVYVQFSQFENKWMYLLIGLVIWASLFVLMFIPLLIIGEITKKRRLKLEKEVEDQ